MSALAALAAGLLAGLNPYVAPTVARLARGRTRGLRAATAAGLAALAAAASALVGVLAWRYSAFVSGRLTYGILVVAAFTLAGAAYAWRPVGRARREEAPPTRPPRAARARRALALAGDVLYYGGPAWALAVALAMREVTAAAFAAPFAAAAAGAALALALGALLPDRLPAERPRAGAPSPAGARSLAVPYALAGLLLVAAFLRFV